MDWFVIVLSLLVLFWQSIGIYIFYGIFLPLGVWGIYALIGIFIKPWRLRLGVILLAFPLLYWLWLVPLPWMAESASEVWVYFFEAVIFAIESLPALALGSAFSMSIGAALCASEAIKRRRARQLETAV